MRLPRKITKRHWVRLWQKSWPRLLALGIVFGVWETVYQLRLRPAYVFPGPEKVFAELIARLQTADFWSAVATTMSRAGIGFAIALAIGSLLGVAVARVRPLRLAIGSLITGLQTMPSIAWFPFAILLFGLGEQAITFVVVLGAAPAIANGVIAGVDTVPPAFFRLGQMLQARGWALYRFIVLPAMLPSYLAGLTQGWAFAWRSLMAGELLVIIAERPSLGAQLEFARQFAKAPMLLATMIVILLIGMLVDGGLSTLSKRVRAGRGLST